MIYVSYFVFYIFVYILCCKATVRALPSLVCLVQLPGLLLYCSIVCYCY